MNSTIDFSELDRVLLSEESHLLREGWVLLRGHLRRKGRQLSASVLAHTGNQSHRINLPVTYKGTIFELVKLPAGVTRLELVPLLGAGEYELTHFTIRRVNIAERTYLMWKRVLPSLRKIPPVQRSRANLFWYTPLLNLPRAYESVGMFRGYSPQISYSDWVIRFDTLTAQDKRAIASRARRLYSAQPVILLDATAATKLSDVVESLYSIKAQIMKPVRVLLQVNDDQAAQLQPYCWPEVEVLGPNRALACGELQFAASDWVLWVPAGKVLAPHALFWFSAMIRRRKDASFIYSDHDHHTAERERVDPCFKPDWSIELARTAGYTGSVFALKAERLMSIARNSAQMMSPYSLMLQATAGIEPSAIVHIPAILWHQLSHESLADKSEERESSLSQEALEYSLALQGIAASVQRTAQGYLRVQYALPASLPKVSILVPTRNMLSHLQPCIESLLSRTGYPDFEVLIIDNQSDDPDTLAFMQSASSDPRVRVLHYDQPFNFSAINNFAAAHAQGVLICLLNNDTEVISEDWLDEMVSQVLQPGVGVVGAKLYFSDGRVQHAGDCVGPGGCADHMYGDLDKSDTGYMDRVVLAQDLSAVTAACMLTPKSLYQKLSGLDAANLAVAFNDVDYCLRVREAGFRVVFTPYAELYHHESVSRGKDDNPEKKARAKSEADYMRKRWRHVMQHDPFYNPNLNYKRADFTLNQAPAVEKPWE